METTTTTTTVGTLIDTTSGKAAAQGPDQVNMSLLCFDDD